MNENKNFADKTARAARETFEKGSAATQQSARGAQESFSAVAEGIRDFNVRLMEMAQLNAVAALDFAREMSTAKGPADAAALWSSHAQKQFETLTEQSKELTALAQRIATSSAEPITRSFGQALQGPLECLATDRRKAIQRCISYPAKRGAWETGACAASAGPAGEGKMIEMPDIRG